MSLFALSVHADTEHADGRHLGKTSRSGSGGHRDKRIISTAAGNGIELVLPALEALFKVTFYICHSGCFCLFLGKSKTCIFFHILGKRDLCVFIQDQICAWHRKAAILLAGSTQHDISDHVKGNIQGFRLIVPDISHLKAALQDCFDIKKAAVHGITSG